jgi:hypothetical protein
MRRPALSYKNPKEPHVSFYHSEDGNMLQFLFSNSRHSPDVGTFMTLASCPNLKPYEHIPVSLLDGQYTYNVILRCFRATIVTVENQ